MMDAHGDENIRAQVCTSVGMKIRMEFHILPNVGLYQSLSDVQKISLCLTHKSFCDGRHIGLSLDSPVGIDIGNLCISHPEYVDLFIFPIKITGDHAFDHLKSL